MITIAEVDDVRSLCDAARADGRSVGLVPTMGAFHAGHCSLMRAARRDCDLVVVSLFVNPTQFGPSEDLQAYPRDAEGDAARAIAEGVDVLFTPSSVAMYPEPMRTTVQVAGLTDRLCGASRPTHFAGVTTVVTKLLSIVGPCRAYFGRKDAQQLAVIRRMVRDLNLPAEIVGCPLVRDASGLAMSSRNAYLTAEERADALVLAWSLFGACEAIGEGERDAVLIRSRLADAIASRPTVRLDYAEVVDGENLDVVDRIEGEVLLAVAAFVGRTRLIDNATVRVDGDHVEAELGVVSVAGRPPTPRGAFAGCP